MERERPAHRQTARQPLPIPAYIARRTSAGMTEREAIRCIKRFIARRIWRLLEHPPTTT